MAQQYRRALSNAIRYICRLMHDDPNSMWVNGSALENAVWCATEVGELLDVMMQLQGEWARNNPSKGSRTPEELRGAAIAECADIAFMAFRTAEALGCTDLEGEVRKKLVRLVTKHAPSVNEALHYNVDTVLTFCAAEDTYTECGHGMKWVLTGDIPDQSGRQRKVQPNYDT
jgi:hypothetical protein